RTAALTSPQTARYFRHGFAQEGGGASVATGEGPVVLLSILKLLGITLNTVLAAPLVVAAGAFSGRWAYHVARAWVRVNRWITGLRIRTRREAGLDPHAPFVFISNHQSHFDVLAV